MKTLIVIPTYNERENIKDLVERIFSVYPDFEVFAVDDNSPDGTGEMLETLKRTYPRLHVVHRPSKLGIGSAHLLGLKFAVERDFNGAVTMDADLSHDPSYIRPLTAKSEEFDLVIGSRHVENGGFEATPWPRVLFSRFSNFLLRFVLGGSFRDYTSGFRCYSVKALQRSGLPKNLSGGYSFLVEILHFLDKESFSVLEIPIIFKYRQFGKSKISSGEIMDTLAVALKLFSRRLLRLKGG